MRNTLFLFCFLPAMLMSAQPYMVKDITTVPIPESSKPSYVGTAGGITYIEAFGNLWKTDGTAAGTSEVAKIRLARPRRGPNAVDVGGRLVFFGYNRYQTQLFSTDGVTATQISAVYDVTSIFADGSRAFFCSFDGLWVTDGTPLGTRQLFRFPACAVLGRIGDDILFTDCEFLYRTDGSSAPKLIERGGAFDSSGVMLGNRIVFIDAYRLRITDGTRTDTLTDASLFDAVLDQSLVSGDRLYFISGYALWVTDGTKSGTRRLVACDPKVVLAGNDLYYTSFGRELWKTDGTPQGATRIAQSTSPIRITTSNGKLFYATDHEIAAIGGSSSSLSAATFVSFIGAIGDRLFFTAYDPATGEELWSADAEGRGAQLSINLAPDGRTVGTTFSWVQAVSDRVLFTANRMLWRSDGTDSGTYSLIDFGLNAPDVKSSVVVNGICYISFGSGGLWRSDGTAAGTYQLAARSNEVARFRDGVIFEGFDDASGFEPWISDGTSAGTHRIADTLPGPASGGMQSGAEVGGQFYFGSYDFGGRLLIWRTDGTTATIIQSPQTFRPSFAEFQGSPYTVAGGELMKVRDGTWTESIGRVVPGARIFPIGSRLLILGADILYPSDGATIDTAFRGFSRVCNAFSDGSLLYWVSQSEGLWRSDGTQAGTFRAAVFSPAAGCSFARDDRWAYFIGDEGQIWTTGLTYGQTFRVTNLAAQLDSSAGLTLAGSKLFFVADDGVHGKELWALPLDAVHRRTLAPR